MKRIALLLAVLLLLPLAAAFAAGKAATPDQAKAFAEAAAAYFKANGQEKALKEFQNKDGKFIKGDLYIFTMDYAGKMIGHGANPKLIGQDLLQMKDIDGKALFVEMIDVAKTKGMGWVEYKWTNPETKTIMPKMTYIINVKDGVFLGAGAYK